MQRVLVTGAAGFIGFHVAQRLRAMGIWCLGVDNYNTYYDVQLKRDRARHLHEQGIEVRELDICTPGALMSLMQKEKITQCIHLAAQAGVRYSIDHPQEYLHTNVDGFLEVLEACKTASVPLIYASSSSVYGRNSKIPFAESDPTDAQTNIYGVTKKTNELMAQLYHHLYGMTTIGLRFFTVYGPWGRPDMALFLFTRAVMAKKPVMLYNHGAMRRDFTYIDDIVQGIMAACSLTGRWILNLGSGRPEPLESLLHAIEEATGRQAERQLVPMPPGEMIETYADLSEAQRVLGFAPTVALREGVQRFVEWYRGYYREGQ